MRPFIALLFLVAACVLAGASPVLAGQVTHTVVSGDSLWSIAAKYRISVASLETRNHLTDSSILQLGQTILIARTSPVRYASRVLVQKRASSVHGARKRVARTAPTGAATNAIWAATHTGQAPAAPGSVNYSLAERIIAFDAQVTHTALRYVGVPYVWGGTSLNGVDCSGFVQAVFEHNGISLPRTADNQYEAGRPVHARDLVAGDLVFFETYAAGASHVGIYLGGGQFIHASSSNGVRVDSLSEDYFAQRYLGARRLIH